MLILNANHSRNKRAMIMILMSMARYDKVLTENR